MLAGPVDLMGVPVCNHDNHIGPKKKFSKIGHPIYQIEALDMPNTKKIFSDHFELTLTLI